MALTAHESHCHIRLMLDNVTAVTYTNKMGGGGGVPADKVVREIWSWAVQRDIWLTTAYVPGDENHIADFKSRHFHDNTEWTLHPTVFHSITNILLPRDRSLRFPVE